MISELRITDLGVINDATLELPPGLTVVTGETGAGKTMIITGLDLLLGARGGPRAVRTGADRARIEARVTVGDDVAERVRDLGGELDDDELLVARHVTAAGRSRAYLGGVQVPAGVCADLTGTMITIHGQSEQVQLSQRSRQRELLDRYAGAEHRQILDRYRAAWEERRAVQTELGELQAAEQERLQEGDRLRFGLAEIERVAPLPGEDVALAAETNRLQSTDDLRSSARGAMLALAGDDDSSGGALAALAAARSAVERLAEADPGAAGIAGRVAEAGYLVTDLTGDLARYLDDLEVQPGRLEEIAARRFELAGLTRRYGDSCDAVLAWAQRATDRLTRLAGADERIAALTDRSTQLDAQLLSDARLLSDGRRAAAATIAAQVLVELAALALPHARLEFALRPVELGPDGSDQVELLFSANPGSDLRPLGQVASGGELSRVRLALEVVLAAGHRHGTFVFDEVDAGVGGRVAVEIGRRLAALADHCQVLVVTHLAQVAAFADRHFVVVKADDGQVTTSGVRQVAETARAAELARMMAGLETSDTALAHAGELLELAAAGRAAEVPTVRS